MSVGKVFAILFGSLLLLIAAALITGAVTILNADQDADDFFVSAANHLERASFAIAGDSDVLDEAPAWFVDWFTDVVDVRMAATSSTGGDLFVGIAATADVEAYLAGVAYDEVTRLDLDPVDVDYRSHEGVAGPALPGAQGFWVGSAEGPATQTLDWSVQSGTWSVVVMNADAARGVSADLVLGVRMENLNTFMWIGFGAGLVLALAGLALFFGGIRSPRERYVPPTAGPATTEKEEHVART
jgi:hypothetical protein